MKEGEKAARHRKSATNIFTISERKKRERERLIEKRYSREFIGRKQLLAVLEKERERERERKREREKLFFFPADIFPLKRNYGNGQREDLNLFSLQQIYYRPVAESD